MSKEVEELQGVIVNTFAPKKWKKQTIHDFKLQLEDDEEVSVSKFCNRGEEFDTDLVGEEVRFEAVYNGEYDRYTVRGEIEAVDGKSSKKDHDEGDGEEDEPSHHRSSKKRGRGRPSKTKTTTRHKSSDEPTGREQHRKEAVASTIKDLEAALGIVDALELDFKNDLTGLVALADRVGRTMSAIAADAGKDRRGAAANVSRGYGRRG